MKVISAYIDKASHELVFLFDDNHKWIMPWMDADHPETPEEEMEWDAGVGIIPAYSPDGLRKEANKMLRFACIWEYIQERIPGFTYDRDSDGTAYYEADLTFDQIKLLITPQP